MSKHGENIYKRKDGRWEGRYKKGYKENGSIDYGYVYAKTYQGAKEKLFANKFETMRPVLRCNLTIRELSCEWLLGIKVSLKESTYAKYVFVCERHILPQFGRWRVLRITQADLNIFIGQKLKHGKLHGCGGLAAKTVRDICGILSAMLSYAENEYAVPNKALKLHLPKINRASVQTLDSKERHKLETYALSNINERRNLAILLSLYAGVRIGEICALKASDIDFASGLLKISKTLQRIKNTDKNASTKTKIIIGAPKSGKSMRDIPLPKFLIKALKKALAKLPTNAYLLTGRDNKYVEHRNLRYYYKKVLKSCGISYVNFHALRHTFASYAVEKGFDVKSLSEILGHTTVEITLNLYVHSSMDLKRKYMNSLIPFECFSRQSKRHEMSAIS